MYLFAVQRDNRQKFKRPLYANEKKRAKVFNSIDVEHLHVTHTQMNVAKKSKRYKEHEPFSPSFYGHVDYRYAIGRQVEVNVSKNIFRNIEPFAHNEIVVHFGGDKSTLAYSNSVAPLCIEKGNSPQNSQLTEVWLAPATDSLHNLTQTMDLQMFDQLQLFPAIVLLVEYRKDETGKLSRTSSSAVLLPTKQEQEILNKRLPNVSECEQLDSTMNAYLRDEKLLRQQFASVNIHEGGRLQVLQFDALHVDVGFSDFVAFHTRSVHSINVSILDIDAGFEGFIAIAQGQQIVGIVCVEFDNGPTPLMRRKGVLLTTTFMCTPFKFSESSLVRVGSRLYIDRGSVHDLNPKKADESIGDVSCVQFVVCDVRLVISLDGLAWSECLNHGGARCSNPCPFCLIKLAPDKLHERPYRAAEYRTTKQFDKDVLHHATHPKARTFAGSHGIKGHPMWRFRLCRTVPPTWHIFEGMAGKIWAGVLYSVCRALKLHEKAAIAHYKEYARLEQALSEQMMALESLEKMEGLCETDGDLGFVQSEQSRIQQQIFETQTLQMTLSNEHMEIQKYKDFVEFANQLGIKKHNYRKDSMQNRYQIKLKRGRQTLTTYIRRQFGDVFADDFDSMIKAFAAASSVVLKKCDGIRKSEAVIEQWCTSINACCDAYYSFIEKYGQPNDSGNVTFGNKVHTLRHARDWMRYFGISPAHVDEERLENMHVAVHRALRVYCAVKGADLIKSIWRWVSLNALLRMPPSAGKKTKESVQDDEKIEDDT